MKWPRRPGQLPGGPRQAGGGECPAPRARTQHTPCRPVVALASSSCLMGPTPAPAWMAPLCQGLTHFLCGDVGLCIMALLGEDDVEDGVGAAAGFIHVCGRHGSGGTEATRGCTSHPGVRVANGAGQPGQVMGHQHPWAPRAALPSHVVTVLLSRHEQGHTRLATSCSLVHRCCDKGSAEPRQPSRNCLAGDLLGPHPGGKGGSHLLSQSGACGDTGGWSQGC